jgi:hypothetical protein
VFPFSPVDMALKGVQGVQEFKKFEERSWGPGEKRRD